MTDKQKRVLEKLGETIEKLPDKSIDDLLLLGEGMAIMFQIIVDKEKEITNSEETG